MKLTLPDFPYLKLLKKISGLLLLLFLFSSAPAFSQSQSQLANKVKAVFLFNFTRFVEWPPSAFTSPDDPFVIGIIGNNPFSSYLNESVSGEKVNKHPIILQYYRDETEIKECHVLYINLTDEREIKKIISTLDNRKVLTVSDAPQFCEAGGMIRFFTAENKIRLQINTNAAKNAQLNISSKLLSVAKTK